MDRLKILLLILITITSSLSAQDTIKVLAIGNSFSQDALMSHLYDLGKASGVTFIIGNAYLAGADLQTHENNYRNNKHVYTYYKIEENGHLNSYANRSLEEIVPDEKWDFISFQQGSGGSGILSTYFPYLENLRDCVRRKVTNPNVRFVLHQTWAYPKTSQTPGFVYYDYDQMKMYKAIVSANKSVANDLGFEIMIPVGTAIQNARTTYLGDTFCADDLHLSHLTGRYTASCVWFEKLSGKPIVGNSYIHKDIPVKVGRILQQAAKYAIDNPYEITSMEYSDYKNVMAERIKCERTGENSLFIHLPSPDILSEIVIYNIHGDKIMEESGLGNKSLYFNEKGI